MILLVTTKLIQATPLIKMNPFLKNSKGLKFFGFTSKFIITFGKVMVIKRGGGVMKRLIKFHSGLYQQG